MKRATGVVGRAALLLAATAAIVVIPSRAATAQSVRLTPTERSFLGAINAVRAAHGLGTLHTQRDLVRAARSHSHDMIAHDYFAHRVFWKRLRRFGVAGRHEGENLAWSSSPQNAVDMLVNAWLRSPEHRANLLSDQYSEIGVGVGIGTFRGYPNAVMVTTDFLGN